MLYFLKPVLHIYECLYVQNGIENKYVTSAAAFFSSEVNDVNQDICHYYYYLCVFIDNARLVSNIDLEKCC